MPQEPRALDPSLSARDGFGAALRRWRQLRGFSQAQLAAVLPVSADQMAKFEKADRWMPKRTAQKLDEYLDAGGELVELWLTGDVERATAPSTRTVADPVYVVHWTQMLGVLAAAGNAVGGRGLLDVVSTEIGVISRYGASATGQVAADFLSVQARWLEFGSWIADNQGDAPRATSWLKRAGETAGRARDSVFGAYTSAYGLFLLPPITVSCSHEHSGWSGTVSISAATLHHLVNDIVSSVRRSGVPKIVLVNGHGGNYVLANIVQELSIEGPNVALFPGRDDWSRARSDAGLESDGHEDMHAGEIETSLLLHLMPDVVRPESAGADHEGSDRRQHLLTLGMRGYTRTGVIGQPSLGDATKGKLVLESLVRSFADYLRVLSE